MAAPKGHERWGNPLKLKTYDPSTLWDMACEYFNWCDENPWIKIDFKGKDADRVKMPTERPYSISGLCIYLNISEQTFFNYASKEGYETHFEVCTHIKQIINTQHFEGGMVGAFNANIVTRKLGLAEKVEQNLNVDDLSRYSTAELIERANALRSLSNANDKAPI